MLLLRGLQHMGGPEIASNWGQPCHIQSMLRGAKPLPVPKASKVEKAEHHDKQYEQLLKSLPWLTFLDESAGLISETHKIVAASSASSAHHDPAPLLEMTDDDMFAALARMDRSRSAEAAAALERGTREFVVRVRGGSRAASSDKQDYHDAVQACCLKDGEEWATKRGFKKTYKASWGKGLPEETCRALVRAWTHRMQCFYDMAVEANDLYMPYTADVVATYQEPPEITALDSGSAPHPKVVERLAVLRSFPF